MYGRLVVPMRCKKIVVVRVDAGWCYKIKFINWWGKVWTVTYNRIGLSSPTYVKVEDASYAEVQAQSASSCP